MCANEVIVGESVPNGSVLFLLTTIVLLLMETTDSSCSSRQYTRYFLWIGLFRWKLQLSCAYIVHLGHFRMDETI